MRLMRRRRQRPPPVARAPRCGRHGPGFRRACTSPLSIRDAEGWPSSSSLRYSVRLAVRGTSCALLRTLTQRMRHRIPEVTSRSVRLVRRPTAARPPMASVRSAPAAISSGSPSPSKPAELVVDVVGKVAKPGVFTLPAGSRIIDAIAAAGGALPHTDLTALDLARKLSDGQEIFVGVPPPSGPAAASAGGVVGDDIARRRTPARAALIRSSTSTPRRKSNSRPCPGSAP